MKKILSVLTSVFMAAQLQAGLYGNFQLAVFAPGEMPAPSYTINGARLSLIYGDCHELNGIDVGTVGSVRERLCGLQVNALWSDVGTDAYGLQIGCVNNVTGDAGALQIALLNLVGDLHGCQIGLANVASNDAVGCQVGLFNYTDNLYGCQIGLINYVDSRSCCIMPIINIGW